MQPIIEKEIIEDRWSWHKESKATEFGEYMAKAAENYMTEVADCWDLGDALTESMLDELKDKTVALQRSIYEFRKRVPNAY